MNRRPYLFISSFALLCGAALAQPGSGWSPCGHGAVGSDPLTPGEAVATRATVHAKLRLAPRAAASTMEVRDE